MAQWAKLKFDEAMFANIDEALLSNAAAAFENCYQNRAKGQSRFPGLKPFASFPCRRAYVQGWRDDLIAVTDAGRFWRIDQAGNVEDITGTPLSGGRRPVFDTTEDELVVAAGGPIIRVSKSRSEVLSPDAPHTTHVCYIDGYLIAIEPQSGRIYYSKPGQPTVWDPLDVIAAEAKPDDNLAAIVTPYRELLVCGRHSIEQFETTVNGSRPFARRWATGEGLAQPYTLVATVLGAYGVNPKSEFVRWSGQVSRAQSNDVDLVLERVDDWTDAWAEEVTVKGQKFVLLQAPAATNVHGTKGITLLYDYANKTWSFLYGWEYGREARWPGWSYAPLWGRHFVGVEGGVAELSTGTFDNLGQPQRMVFRTGHMSEWGPSRIDDFKIRMKRGLWPSGTNPPSDFRPKIGIRCNKDNLGFRDWYFRDLGRYGERDMTVRLGGWGCADTWQFEYFVSDPVETEFVEAWALIERLGH